MKKLLALLCAGILTCSMGLVAFASSPDTTNTTPDVTENTGHSTQEGVKVWNDIVVDGKTVSADALEITGLSDTVEAVAESEAVARGYANVVQAFDVTFDGEFSSLTISFNLTGGLTSDIVALHQLKDGSWEVLTPDSIDPEKGTVTVTFTSLSPVVFVSGAAATPGASTPAAPTSPKTADGYAMYVAMLAVVAFAGAAVVGKKVVK